MHIDRQTAGVMMTLAGGVLWGFSGTCGQFIIQRHGVTSNWMVPYRLLLAGTILLLFCLIRKGPQQMKIEKADLPRLLTFAILGVGLCQYTYFTAIGASNSGTATVLQYTSPVMIMVYTALRNRKMPKPVELLCIFLAISGTFLLATHGKPGSLIISRFVLVVALISAASQAAYTVIAVPLLRKYGSPLVNGWAMIIGGICLFALFRPWTIPVQVTMPVILGMSAIILFGTVCSFSLYLAGVNIVGPQTGNLLCSIEPVSATLFSVFWMGTAFLPIDLLGFACILSTIFILSYKKKAQ